MVADANCGKEAGIGAALTINWLGKEKPVNHTRSKYNETQLSTEIGDAANVYVQSDNDNDSWVHSGAINVVYADGHCGSITKQNGLTPADFVIR